MAVGTAALSFGLNFAIKTHKAKNHSEVYEFVARFVVFIVACDHVNGT